MSKIIGVTVGTTMSPQTIKEKLKPVLSVNGEKPDENGDVSLGVTKENIEAALGYTPADHQDVEAHEERICNIEMALPEKMEHYIIRGRYRTNGDRLEAVEIFPRGENHYIGLRDAILAERYVVARLVSDDGLYTEEFVVQYLSEEENYVRFIQTVSTSIIRGFEFWNDGSVEVWNKVSECNKISVTEISGGHRVTITDVSGTKSFDAAVTKTNIEAALGYKPANGDEIWAHIESADGRISDLENSMSVYSYEFFYQDNGDGTYEATGGHDYEAILEAYSHGYRVRVCTYNEDYDLYEFNLSKICTDYIVFTSPEFEVRHYEDGRWQMTKRDIVADVIAALPIYNGEVEEV